MRDGLTPATDLLLIENNVKFQKELITFLETDFAHIHYRTISVEEAAPLLTSGAPLPHLVLLCIEDNPSDGIDLLIELERDPRTALSPLLVISPHASQETIRKCLEHGANGFIHRGKNVAERRASLSAALEFWLGYNLVPRRLRHGA